MVDLTAVRAQLSGPIGSVRTLFRQDGEIDFDGVRGYVDYLVAAGSRTVLLTIGDSHLLILTDDEVAELTRVVVEQTAGRALVVAADKAWGTLKCVEFARYARGLGADVLMVSPRTGAAREPRRPSPGTSPRSAVTFRSCWSRARSSPEARRRPWRRCARRWSKLRAWWQSRTTGAVSSAAG